MRKILVLISLLLLVGCGERRKSTSNAPPKEPATFKDSSFTDIIPMVDGSVYTQDFDGRLWHVSNAVATQVKSPAEKLPYFGEIVPCADGSAYATSYEAGLWHLVGAKAIRVSEFSQTSGGVRQPPTSEGLFALYAYELRRRIAAENRAEEAESRAEDRGNDSDEDY